MSLEQRPRRILGIDPGTAIVGYGVLDCPDKEVFSCKASGIIQTPKHLSPGQRLNMIRNDLLDLLLQYRPDVVAVEAIFFFKNAKTLVPVAQARGVILEAAASLGIATVEYTPMQVKLTLTGFGRADKSEVQIALARVLKHRNIIKPDDAADALALAICHARMSVTAGSQQLSSTGT